MTEILLKVVLNAINLNLEYEFRRINVYCSLLHLL
jgi:hypothetical protein